jgi:hypothetical protein
MLVLGALFPSIRKTRVLRRPDDTLRRQNERLADLAQRDALRRLCIS